MAIGTVTVANRVNHGYVKVLYDVISFPGDGAYPTGGTAAFEASVRTAVGRGALDIVAVVALDCGIYSPVYDYTNDKLKVRTEALAEVANTTDLSGTTFRILVISK